MHPNPQTQKILDDTKERTEKSMAFADVVMKLMDSFVPAACKEQARTVLTRAAGQLGLEIHRTRQPNA
jgi:hypothetical protein